VQKIMKRRSVRIAVISAAGLVGAGAMGILAIPATAAVPTVTFKGGCHTVSASSLPDREEITTQKSGTAQKTADIVVVNRLNTSGTLYADGKVVKWPDGDAVVLEKGDSVTVPLTSGDVALTLVPDCDIAGLNTNLTEDYRAVTVSVVAAPGKGSQKPSGDRSGADEPTAADGSGDDAPGGADSESGSDEADPPAVAQQPVARDAVPPGAGESAAATTEDGTAPDMPADAEAAPLVPKNHTSGTVSVILAWVAALCLLGVVVATLRTLMRGRSARVSSS
jgi:membrane-bound inhibitor of C-type lysozyme